MQQKNSTLTRALVVAVSLLVTTLAGCGGGSGSGSSSDSDKDGVANASDCAPNDASAWQNLPFASRDEDTDSFRANTGGQVCAGATLPANRFAAAAVGNEIDCNDADAQKWRLMPYASRDEDADTFRANTDGEVCTGAILPPNHFATAAVGNDIDCNDADAQKWRLLPYASRDEDQDGYRVNVAGSYCGQETLPANYSTTNATTMQLDCDDASASTWYFSTIYRDLDGDGVGAGARVIACVGNTAPSGLAFTGYDPLDDPNDPASTSVSNLELPVYLLVKP